MSAGAKGIYRMTGDLGRNESSTDLPLNVEGDVKEILDRLDDMVVLNQPDRDIPSSLDDSASTGGTDAETRSIGAGSSHSGKSGGEETGAGKSVQNGGNSLSQSNNNSSEPNKRTSDSPQKDTNKSEKPGDKNRKNSGVSPNDSTKKKSSNPVKNVLKKFAKSDKADKSKSKPSSADLKAITIDRLPQVFVVKYLGKVECNGVWGVKHVRKPVDELVYKVTNQLDTQSSPVALPLLYLIVSHKGMDLREHPHNTTKDLDTIGLIPIEFISYGVQDIKFWRVFCFIVVREMSSRSKKMECHACICDSTIAARRIAVSLGAAFKVYLQKLQASGKEHKFQVELRPPDELADKYEQGQDEEDC